MQKYIYVLLLLTGVLILAGCIHSTEENIGGSQTNLEDDDKTVNNNTDIYDFYFVNRAPKAKGKNELDEVIKFYFSTNSPISTKIAIDVKNGEIYIDPRHLLNGVKTYEEPVTFGNKESLIKILAKYNVQDWEEDYTTQDPNTYTDGDGIYYYNMKMELLKSIEDMEQQKKYSLKDLINLSKKLIS